MKQVEETVEDTGNNREFCSIRSFIHYLHTVSPPDSFHTHHCLDLQKQKFNSKSHSRS